MDKRKLIMRIALWISLAALVFSMVTFIRSIVLGSGVLPSLLLVFTTGIVVAVCYLMQRAYSNYSDEYDQDESEDDSPATAEAAPAHRRHTERAPEPEPGYSLLDPEPTPDPQPGPQEPDEPSEPVADDIAEQVDALISELEKDNTYDLSNFE